MQGERAGLRDLVRKRRGGAGDLILDGTAAVRVERVNRFVVLPRADGKLFIRIIINRIQLCGDSQHDTRVRRSDLAVPIHIAGKTSAGAFTRINIIIDAVQPCRDPKHYARVGGSHLAVPVHIAGKNRGSGDNPQNRRNQYRKCGYERCFQCFPFHFIDSPIILLLQQKHNPYVSVINFV